MGEYKILTGNEACALGALAAGMDFFAGYPITPATEIAEMCSELLPLRGGKFIQMEDELGSIAAVIGASFAGAKAMTATSGPGFSLMQENLGYGMMAEVPCVLVNVMRQGPCQGVATVPAQGDIMQCRWGAHGDHPVIALSPCSVSEMYRETVRAFNLAEKYRTPVILLSDAMLAHMSEKVRIPAADELEIVKRKTPFPSEKDYRPYADDGSGVPPMAVFGDGHRWYVSGIVHDETGFPVTGSPDAITWQVERLLDKINRYEEDIQSWEEYRTEDAEYVLIGIGVMARSAKTAVDILRDQDIRAGLFRPVTVWPFPETRLSELLSRVHIAFACEMNEGQLYHVVRAVSKGSCEVASVTQNNGKMITAGTLVAAVKGAI